jgi:16S rRNA processing protein RimM
VSSHEAPGDVGPVPGADRLEVGRVGRAHGLDGSFYVTRPKPRLLAVGARVRIEGSVRRVLRNDGTERRPIVRLEGIEDRGAAEALRGLALTVAFADAPALRDGEWWAHELVGCAVVDGERVVGRVRGLLELPSCEALEVQSADGGELLLPMVKDAIRGVDAAAGRIDVDMRFIEE